MGKFLKFAALALLAAVPTTMGSSLWVHNNCHFDIFCDAAKNDGKFSGGVKVAQNGGTYMSPLPADNDNVGTVLKCALDPGLSRPFQMELAVQNGRSWFDLSAIDGDPFIQFHRHAEIAGQCVLDCEPWSTACEYPVQVDCPTTEDAWLNIC
ncbi:hypothetical protein GGR54DRAFT_644459 [Hypoxylon sp. NC1633]|nr:hypothetical protein GGR54DRAFT_644459 [Hypoxylon sp. NC1633]